MEVGRLKIVKPKIKTWIKICFSIGVLIILSLLISLFLLEFNFEKPQTQWENREWIFAFVLVFSILLLKVSIHLNMRVILNIGEVIFLSDKLIINTNIYDENIDFEEIENIKFTVNGYLGQTLSGGDKPKAGMDGESTSFGLNQVQGYKNKVKIRLKNRKKYNLNFYLANKDELVNFKLISSEIDKLVVIKVIEYRK